jgi:hypothetical protein
LDICLAMSPMQLPNYVLLEIIDWLPHWEVAVRRFKKITLIENINRSISRVLLLFDSLVTVRCFFFLFYFFFLFSFLSTRRFFYDS